MKHFQFSLFMIAVLLLVSACGGAPGHMLFKDDPTINVFRIRPEKGKAAIVVARTTSYGGAVEFDTYLDKKMIGVTKGKSYFIKTDVAPGVRLCNNKGRKCGAGKNQLFFETSILHPGDSEDGRLEGTRKCSACEPKRAKHFI